MQNPQIYPLWITQFLMILIDNPMIATSKVADTMDSKAIGRTIDVDTMEVMGVIKGDFMATEMKNHVIKMAFEIRVLI